MRLEKNYTAKCAAYIYIYILIYIQVNYCLLLQSVHGKIDGIEMRSGVP